MLRALAVDDEPLAHEVLAHLCQCDGGVELAATCLSAAEALAHLQNGRFDLMFLDVRMPVFGGLDLLRGLDNPPLTVIVSAHQDHAFDGFELDVVDYLLKPVSQIRFASAMEKVRRRLDPPLAPATAAPACLTLRVGRGTRRVRLDRVSCFQAYGNFVRVWSEEGNCLATATLHGVREQLPERDFVQVHRSFVVRRDRISAQTARGLMLDTGMAVPIGRSFRKLTLT